MATRLLPAPSTTALGIPEPPPFSTPLKRIRCESNSSSRSVKRSQATKTFFSRAANEGHEIGTQHTWDDAEGSGQGVSLILMSSERTESRKVEKGLQAIKDATGQDASLMFRSPGGNFDASVAGDLSDLIDAEIGWNI